MPIESVSRIADLDPANPPGSDQASTLDNHIRLTKTAIKTLLCGVPGAAEIQGREITDGAITPTASAVISLVPEGGSGADTLDTIELDNIPDGGVLLLRAASSANPITVAEGGNIQLKGNESFLLDDPLACIFLLRNGSSFFEILRDDKSVPPSVFLGRKSGVVTEHDFLLPDGFNWARFQFRGVNPDTNPASLILRLSQNEGSSFISSTDAYAYILSYIDAGVAGEAGESNTFARLNRSISLTTQVDGYLDLYYTGGRVIFNGTTWRRRTATTQIVTHIRGELAANTNPCNAIRFSFSIGGINSGFIFGHAFK